jgi:hypothetical protein
LTRGKYLSPSFGGFTIPFTVSANPINIQQADVTVSKTLVNGIDSTKALVGSDVIYRLTVFNH